MSFSISLFLISLKLERGIKMKRKFQKILLVCSVFSLFSCDSNDRYYDSSIGLINEHTLKYKTNGLVLGDPQYVHFEDGNLVGKIKNNEEVFTNLQTYYESNDSLILFTADASFSFKYFENNETGYKEKYCYKINTMYYELYLEDNMRIRFYAPSYLEMNLPKKLNDKVESKISFDEYKKFYSKMSNYAIEESNERIKLEVYSFNPGIESSKKLDDIYYLNIKGGYSSITKD